MSRRPDRARPVLVHLTTTDMSLDWLLGPQLRAFGEAGYDVIGMSAPGPHVHAIEAMGVRHVPVPAFTRSNDPVQDLRAFRQLVGLLRDLRPDILHTHNPKPGVLGRVAGRLTRVPLIVNTQHGLYAQPSDTWKRRKAAMSRRGSNIGPHRTSVRSTIPSRPLLNRTRIRYPPTY